MAEQTYIYDAAWEQERARLTSLERANDPYTRMHCEQLGIAPGWTCLEIGAGGGSITAWMCERVGPTGRVVATDLDTRFVSSIDAPNLEVRRHDIVSEDLEQGAYDLVHSRFLLEHLPERERVLDTMISAVRPGGWLLVEDIDFTDIARPDDVVRTSGMVAPRYFEGLRAFMRSRGIDPDYGSKLPERLIAHGLTDVDAAGRRILLPGGSEAAEVARLSTVALRQPMVTGGFVTDDEVQAALDALASPGTLALSPMAFAAWGRRPT